MSRTFRSGDERGFALLAALGLLVALSALSLEFGLRARERRLVAANSIERGTAIAAARGGVQHALARLDAALARAAIVGSGASESRKWLDPWSHATTLLPDTVAIGREGRRALYRVTLEDANTALNVNRASEHELRRLMLALRIDAGRADQVAQAIADWRDPDDLRRARGAERAEYQQLGAAAFPRNGPFAEVRELRSVNGMTPEIYERMRPFVTVLGTGQVNINRAEAEVLLSLPGMTAEAVAVLRGKRRGIRNLNDLLTDLSTGPRAVLLASLADLNARVTFETREVVVSSKGWVEGGVVHAVVEALVVRGGTEAMAVSEVIR